MNSLAEEFKGTDLGEFVMVFCLISLFYTFCLAVVFLVEESKKEEAKRIERARKIEEERRRKERRYFSFDFIFKTFVILNFLLCLQQDKACIF